MITRHVKRARAKWLWCVVVGLSAAIVGSSFARRSPVMPDPNGHDRLRLLAAAIPAEAHDLPGSDPSAVAQFARAHSNLIAEVTAAVALPSLMPLEFSPDQVSASVTNGMNFRRLEKAILACADYAEKMGDLDQATTGRLSVIQLGQQYYRGGLMIDYLLGSAIQLWGLTQLSNSVIRLDEVQCQRVVDGLIRLQNNQEPLSSFDRRERRWMIFGSGWWRSWEGVRELPRVFRRPSKTPSLFGTPAARDAVVQRAYSQTLAAAQLRLSELRVSRPPN